MAKHGLTDDFFNLAGSKKTRKKKRDKVKLERSDRNSTKDLSASSSPNSSFVKASDYRRSSDVIEPSDDSQMLLASSSPSMRPPTAVTNDVESETDSTSDDKQIDSKGSVEPLPQPSPAPYDNKPERSSFSSIHGTSEVIPLSSVSTSTKPPVTLTNEYETRRYQLVIYSKLPVIAGKSDSIKIVCRGSKAFAKVIEAALAQFKLRFAENPQVVAAYEIHDCCLVWKEGLAVVNPGWSPSYLRIPKTGDEDQTEVAFLLIPKVHENDFETFYPDLGYTNPDSDEKEIDVLDVNLIESSDEAEPVEEDKEEKFMLGLKGADNKRIDIQASPSTPIRYLLQEYLKAKKLDPKTKATLMFDDEPLNLNDIVGDTELEDEFEIQVRM